MTTSLHLPHCPDDHLQAHSSSSSSSSSSSKATASASTSPSSSKAPMGLLFTAAIVFCSTLTALLLLSIRGGESIGASLVRVGRIRSLKNDSLDHPSPSHHCDPLPLEGGHNGWDPLTESPVRMHTDSDVICGPKVLVIGAMKCGTNTLGHLLSNHPRVKVNACGGPKEQGCFDPDFQGRNTSGNFAMWEGHDFSIKRNRDPQFWLSNFTHRLPWTDGIHNISMDKSPSYLNVLEFPNITQLFKQYLPNAKIAISVCNPSLRLYSEYNHNMDQIPDPFLNFYRDKDDVPVPTTFPQFVDLLFQTPDSELCSRLPRFCERNKDFYLRKGQYSTLIQEWISAFGKENVLVVDMKDPQYEIAEKLLELVGHDILPPEEYPWEAVKDSQEVDFQSKAEGYTGRTSAFSEFPREIGMLERYYAMYNQELARLIGRDFPLEWNAQSSES